MVRVALQIYPEHAEYADFRRAVQTAESLGVDTIYTWDHFFPLFGSPNGAHFECWTLLAAIAEITERVAFGAMVTCNSYRNPELLADMARTVDHISGGRLILGIGSGWVERDYEEYGYEFGTHPSRLRDLAAALPRIERRLAKLNPKPLGKLPLLIGGGGEKVTLKLTARHANIWHGFARGGSTDEMAATVRHKNEVLDGWCRELGREPAEIERSIGVSMERLEAADAICAAGAQEITVGIDGPYRDFGPLEDWLAWRDARNA